MMICKNAAIRWTDNLFELQNWIQKSTNMSLADLQAQFPIFTELDYP